MPATDRHPCSSFNPSSPWVRGAFCLALITLLAGPAPAAIWPEDPGITVTRSFEYVELPDTGQEAFFATWTLGLDAEAILSGLFYSEQFPAWLTVEVLEARVGDQSVSCRHEIGEAGEVHAELVPHRFIFDDPAGEDPDLSLGAGDVLVLEYTLRSGVPGPVQTLYNGWCGLIQDERAWPVGGWADEAPVLDFLRDESPLMLEDIAVISAVDHLRVIWSLSLEGEMQSFRLQRGLGPDPRQSIPLSGEILQGPGEYRYDDHSALPGEQYWYWLAILDASGEPLYYLGPGVGGLAESALAGRFLRNFPNPFNPSTTLRFALADEKRVDLAIYNMQGRKIRALRSGVLSASEHDLIWDGRDFAGSELASGTYFARLLVEGDEARIRKLTLIR